jgi:curved DNA-binding protein CbpA
LVIHDDAPFDDPYRTLGLSPGCSYEQILKAYRKLAFRHHPDRNLGREAEAAAEFRLIQAAFERLSDQAYRAAREAARRTAKSARRSGATGDSVARRPSRPGTTRRKTSATTRATKLPTGEPPATPPSAPGRPAFGRAPSPEGGATRRAGPLRLLFGAASGVFFLAVRIFGAALLLLGGPTFASGALKLRLRRALEGRSEKLFVAAELSRVIFYAALATAYFARIAGRSGFGDFFAFVADRREWTAEPLAAIALLVALAALPAVLAERLLLAGIWIARAEKADRVGAA